MLGAFRLLHLVDPESKRDSEWQRLLSHDPRLLNSVARCLDQCKGVAKQKWMLAACHPFLAEERNKLYQYIVLPLFYVMEGCLPNPDATFNEEVLTSVPCLIEYDLPWVIRTLKTPFRFFSETPEAPDFMPVLFQCLVSHGFTELAREIYKEFSPRKMGFADENPSKGMAARNRLLDMLKSAAMADVECYKMIVDRVKEEFPDTDFLDTRASMVFNHCLRHGAPLARLKEIAAITPIDPQEIWPCDVLASGDADIIKWIAAMGPNPKIWFKLLPRFFEVDFVRPLSRECVEAWLAHFVPEDWRFEPDILDWFMIKNSPGRDLLAKYAK